jgi:hypothetical protein
MDKKRDLDSEELSDFGQTPLKLKDRIRKSSALTNHQGDVILLGFFHHLLGLFRIEGHWFFNQDMLLGHGGLKRDRMVKVIGEGYDHCVDLCVIEDIFVSGGEEPCPKTLLCLSRPFLVYIGHGNEINLLFQELDGGEMGLCNSSTSNHSKS